MEDLKYTTLEEIRDIVGRLVEQQREKGIKRVFCVACGGSLSCFYPMTYLLRSEAKTFTCESITANEFVHATPKGLGDDSVVFAMSLAGGTPETVEAARVAREAGAVVVTLTSKVDAPLVSYGNFHVLYRIETDNVIENVNQYVILALAFELLNQAEGTELYNDALDGFARIPGICQKALGQVRNRARVWGSKMKNAPVLYTMGSGPSSFVAYMQSICMFMEMEWVNSSSIHTGEY